MTREEILQMDAGPDMDALIHEKVMRRTLQRIPKSGGGFHYRGEIRSTERYDFLEVRGHGDSGGYTDRIPPYSLDIAAAWEVVEKYWGTMIDRCTGASPEVTVTITGRNGERFEASAEEMPLAVCRAALLTTLSE